MAVNDFIEKEKKKQEEKKIVDENKVREKKEEKEEKEEKKYYLRVPVLVRQTNAPPGWEPCEEELMADTIFKYFKREKRNIKN
jgi:hypothetical protein